MKTAMARTQITARALGSGGGRGQRLSGVFPEVQRLHQRAQLLARGDVGQRNRHRPDLRPQVGHGQAEGEQFAIDDPVAQPGSNPEADTSAQRLDTLVQTLAVAGLGDSQAVAPASRNSTASVVLVSPP